MSVDRLSDHLSDLSTQFSQPHTRHWEPINWQAINPTQIIGVNLKVFTLVLSGATEIEAPIRDYSRESWQYLQALHPEMAHFVGGLRYDDGSLQTPGVWEKEERQHAPAFSKIYHQLSGEKLQPKPNSVTRYSPTEAPWEAVQDHLISRISTEWGASAVYLWLMAHFTGALQQAIAQPLQDEVNHLAKFWGFSRWAFGASYGKQLQGSTRNLFSLAKHHQEERTQGNELLHSGHSTKELAHAIELNFSLMRVMVRLRNWNLELSPSYLRHLFGASPSL